MKYAEILNRIELAAECVIKDIELDQREPEELAAEGIVSWEERPISEVATEIGQLVMQQFIEVLPLSEHDPNCPHEEYFQGINNASECYCGVVIGEEDCECECMCKDLDRIIARDTPSEKGG